MLQVGTPLTFTALSGNSSVSETITITVPNPPLAARRVSGQVYNLNQSPLGNVKVTLKAAGQTGFPPTDTSLSLASFGQAGTDCQWEEANLGVFAILAVSVNLIDGVLNNLDSAILTSMSAEVQVSQTFTTVVTNPNVPGGSSRSRRHGTQRRWHTVHRQALHQPCA
jgi:hypothetical protein